MRAYSHTNTNTDARVLICGGKEGTCDPQAATRSNVPAGRASVSCVAPCSWGRRVVGEGERGVGREERRFLPLRPMTCLIFTFRIARRRSFTRQRRRKQGRWGRAAEARHVFEKDVAVMSLALSVKVWGCGGGERESIYIRDSSEVSHWASRCQSACNMQALKNGILGLFRHD